MVPSSTPLSTLTSTPTPLADMSTPPPAAAAPALNKDDDGWISQAAATSLGPEDAKSTDDASPAAPATASSPSTTKTEDPPAAAADPETAAADDDKKADRALSSLASRIGGLTTEGDESSQVEEAAAPKDGAFLSFSPPHPLPRGLCMSAALDDESEAADGQAPGV